MHKFIPLAAAVAIALGTALLPACKKSDFENLEFADRTAEFAFPLFSTELFLKDLLLNLDNPDRPEDTVFINPDNTITLFYAGDVAEKPASDIFKFLSNTQPIIMFDSVFSSPIQSPDGVTVRVADLKAGTIGFFLQNTTAEKVTGYFEVSEMTFMGVVFKVPFSVEPGNTFISDPIPLAGHNLNLSDNKLTFKYFAYRPDGVRIRMPVTPGAVTNALEFTYVEGYWGFQWYQLTRDTIEININQTELKGDLKVKDPKVTMRISNSWGFPTRGQIKYLSFIGQNGEEIPLQGTIFQKDSFEYVDFNYPSWALGEVGQTKFTDVVLDGTNSNIADIFNSQPTRLIYEVDGISNALRDPNLIGFITDESNIKLQMRVELALEGAVRNFGAEQTMNLDFGQFGSLESEGIEDIEFKIVTENGTPISSSMQIYFRDENGNYLDSLFTGGAKDIIRSAPVNNQGVSVGTTRTEEFVPMLAARFDRIRGAKDAFLKTYFTTANNGETFVKLLATDKIVVKMGLKVRKKIN